LPYDARPTLVARLWERARGAQVLIEPGTPRGWATIRAAREQLRATGAALIAPCPHQQACPLPADDWCHFSRRLARGRLHRTLKGAELGYEDEKYAYIAVARQPGQPVGARVLRHPLVRSGYIELTLCTPDGIRRLSVTRSAGATWRMARDLRWGDTLPPEFLNDPQPPTRD
jgi:ribosomal protein RSM22 (predicted rRNA methylase)